MTKQIPTYNALDSAAIANLEAAIDNAIRSGEADESEAAADIEIPQALNLIGISESVYRQIQASLRAGKRHLMFYGPPGTGKTSLAEHVAGVLSDDYKLVTGSADWTSQDLIGGYQPTGTGGIRFVPGVLLANFDKPLIIDELNRCDIDKVIGPLFTVLSGQPTTLPYLEDPTNQNSNRYVILPAHKANAKPHEFSPTSGWRLIATINTIDKASLYQLSYALTRRFAWIFIDKPEDTGRFIWDYCTAKPGVRKPATGLHVIPLARVWDAVNDVRPLGPAPIIDIISMCSAEIPDFNFFKEPDNDMRRSYLDGFYTFLLPMLDGILRDEANKIAEGVCSVLAITDESTRSVVNSRLLDLSL
jgi:5-methylcytosine-specific restriction protein B